MGKRAIAKAVPIGPPQVMAAEVAAQEAASIGAGLVKAATTPIYSRKRTEVWDREREEWIPVEREREANITPAAVAVGGLLVLGAAAVAQRGLRTGVITTVTQNEYIGRLGQARDRKVWVDDGAQLPQPRTSSTGGTEVFTATGRTRERPSVRTRATIADYQPVVHG